jgi:PAS domain S-box-containing protein
MLALRAPNLQTTYEAPLLLAGMNFTFSTLASVAVAVLMARGFLEQRAPGLLLVGCGVLVWGDGSFAASIFGRNSPNLNVTIHNLCVWLAACGLLAGVSLGRKPRQAVAAMPLWVGVGYALALGLVGLIVQATLAGWIPRLFVQGQGGTPARYFVLSSAISMLVLSAALLRPAKGRAWPAFAWWYALALLLLAAGLFGVMIQSVAGSLLGWTGRTAQFLGGAYMIVAALASRREAGAPAMAPEPESGQARQRYLVTVAIVIAAAAVRLAFFQVLGTRAAFITFYPAVMLAALYGGWRSGLLATLLSVLLADYYWVEPTGQFGVNDTAGWLTIGVFVVSCTMMSWITEAMLRAQARSRAAQIEARLAEERARAAEALRQSEELLRAVTDNSPEAIYVKDGQSRWLMANPAVLRIVGRTAEQALGKTDAELYADPAIGRAILENDRRVLEGGGAAEFEEIADTPQGRRTFLSIKAPRRDAAGRITGIVGISRDITESKEAEAAVLESRDRLQRVLEVEAVGVMFWDLSTGRLVDANDTFLKMMGYSREDVETQVLTWQKFTPPEYHEVSQAEIRKFQASGRIGPYEKEYFRKDGTRQWLLFSGSSLGHNRCVEFCIDISDRKKAEEALRARTAELTRANAELAEFNELMVGRELRMIDLKKEINQFCQQAGQPARYAVDGEEEKA